MSLLTLPAATWEAIEVDLLSHGWLLADVPSKVSWRAVLGWLRHGRYGSAVFREHNGDAADWTPSAWLLAEVVDQLRWLHSATPVRADHTDPQRWPRPVTPGAQEELGEGQQRWGGPQVTLSAAEMDAYVRANFFEAA